MRSAFVRCGSAAVVALLLWVAIQVLAIAWLCPPHRAWLRQQAGSTAAVLDRGDRVARPGDSIFSCEVAHRTASVTWHLDLDCFCAPATLTAEQVGRSIGGICALDKVHPTLADASGACQLARCRHHLGVD